MDPEEAFVQSVRDKRSHHHGDPTLKREATTIFKAGTKIDCSTPPFRESGEGPTWRGLK
jgi:hypothetical protein